MLGRPLLIKSHLTFQRAIHCCRFAFFSSLPRMMDKAGSTVANTEPY